MLKKPAHEGKPQSYSQYQKADAPTLLQVQQNADQSYNIDIGLIENVEEDQRAQDYNTIEVSEAKVKKFLFKSGDDLRQDNLVLQFFKIMDKLWNDLDMKMVCYDAMESGFETGYIEFIDNATVITDMHKRQGFLSGPF